MAYDQLYSMRSPFFRSDGKKGKLGKKKMKLLIFDNLSRERKPVISTNGSFFYFIIQF
jgi:hypothetical protein